MSTQPMQAPTGQFLRFCQLIVIANSGNPTVTASSLGATDLGTVNGVQTFSTGVAETTSNGTSAIDLSNLRITFEVQQSDQNIPNTLRVRIYNVAPATRNKLLQLNPSTKPSAQMPPGAIPAGGVAALTQAGAVNGGNPPQQQHEYLYNQVQLTVGYRNGPKSLLFTGDIITYRFGKERNVDSYLELIAADGDSFYNQTVVSFTVPAGSTPAQQVGPLINAGGIDASQATTDLLNETGGIVKNIRGKVSFGLARLAMNNVARNLGTRWSIQNGVLTLVPITGYLPGTVININSSTGMIGTPEATDQGVIVRCYINPLIQIGQAVQLLTSDIQQTLVVQSELAGASITSNQFIATVPNNAPTALFRVIVAEHRATQGATTGIASSLAWLSIQARQSTQACKRGRRVVVRKPYLNGNTSGPAGPLFIGSGHPYDFSDGSGAKK
jgi:hypothetical protein